MLATASWVGRMSESYHLQPFKGGKHAYNQALPHVCLDLITLLATPQGRKTCLQLADPMLEAALAYLLQPLKGGKHAATRALFAETRSHRVLQSLTCNPSREENVLTTSRPSESGKRCSTCNPSREENVLLTTSLKFWHRQLDPLQPLKGGKHACNPSSGRHKSQRASTCNPSREENMLATAFSKLVDPVDNHLATPQGRKTCLQPPRF